MEENKKRVVMVPLELFQEAVNVVHAGKYDVPYGNIASVIGELMKCRAYDSELINAAIEIVTKPKAPTHEEDKTDL